MNTEFEILKSLEGDLDDVASRERIRLQRTTLQGSIRRNTGRSWMKVAGVAAAFLVVAGSIGFVASGGLGVSEESKFNQVGGAVASDGDSGGAAPEPTASPITAEDSGPSATTRTSVSACAIRPTAASSRTSRRSSGTGGSGSSWTTARSAIRSAS